MKFTLYNIGKTDVEYIRQGIEDYTGRISHFTDFSIIDLPAVKHTKKTSPDDLTSREGDMILKAVSGANLMILLDEKGKEFTTNEFSNWLKNVMNQGIKKIAFVTGGAYGFSENLYRNSSFQIALSKFTFTHQMARLIFVEQFYRALTIVKGIPYHNN